MFKFRFKQRVDADIDYFEQVGSRISSPKALPDAIRQGFNESEAKYQQRRQVIEKLAGRVDGVCSRRIVEYFLQNV